VNASYYSMDHSLVSDVGIYIHRDDVDFQVIAKKLMHYQNKDEILMAPSQGEPQGNISLVHE
jgi:hypothetical protein